MHKTRSATGTTAAVQQAQPVGRDYVEKIHRRARQLAGDGTGAADSEARSKHTRQEQQKIEQEMAQLRSRAVQARKLAEHIENMSRPSGEPQWMPTTMTTTQDHSEATGTNTRRKEDTRPGASSQMNFNPLHPSMELPPEQLIRLLGLQTRKTRKHKKRKKPQPPAAARAAATQTAEAIEVKAAPVVPSVRETPRATAAPPAFDKPRRRGLLLPSAITGVVLGVAVSAWLFLGSSGTAVEAKIAATAKSMPGPVSKPVPAAVTPAKPAPAAPATATPAAQPAAQPAAAPPPLATAQAASPATLRTDQEWLAATRAEGERLYNAARQRLNDRLMAVETGPQAVEQQEPPVIEEAGTVTAAKLIAEEIPADYSESAPVSAVPDTAASTDSPAESSESGVDW